jgi:hypothetical protein
VLCAEPGACLSFWTDILWFGGRLLQALKRYWSTGKRYWGAGAISGLLLLVGFLIFHVGVATEYAKYSQQQHAEQRAKSKRTEENQLYAFWRWTTGEPVTFYTFVLAIFTGVLGISTVGLWFVTWRSGIRQSRDMEGAIAAARAANEISREAIIADQRAWVTVGDMQFENGLIFKKNGADLALSVKVANVGKTPALDVHTQMEMLYDYGQAPDAIKKLSENCKLGVVVHWTRALLPGDSYRRKWGFTIQAQPTDNIIFPVIIGCTTYRIVPDKSLHQTAFVFDLFECKSDAPSEYVDSIRPIHGTLPKDKLGWDGAAGGFAD